ncbi:alcohol dehydrogenase catalytic domain-containing protein, partial [Rhodoplanes roseus]
MTTTAVPTTMAAWQSDAPGVSGLARTTLPVPHPRPNELLVRVDAAALNFSDLLMLDDAYQVRPVRPFVPGQEIAGTVMAAGAEAGLAVGTPVAGKVVWGGFAEYALMRADMAIPMPKGTDPATAAALPISYTTAMVALTEATVVAPGETVLVLAAAGGVGLA